MRKAMLLLAVVGFVMFAWLHGTPDQTNRIFVVVGSFVFRLLGALWVARRIESRFILHGFLVGVVAVVYYVISSLPVSASNVHVFNADGVLQRTILCR